MTATIFNEDEVANVCDNKGNNTEYYYVVRDPNNNCTQYTDASGIEYWNDYDEHDRLIHYKDSKGYERWIEYRKDGIYSKDNTGYESLSVYDKNNNILYFKDNSKEYSNEYDERNNIIRHSNIKNGSYYYKTYDERNNCTTIVTDLGCSSYYYDKNNNLIEEIHSCGFRKLYVYNKKGNLIYSIDANKNEEWYKYDKNNHMIYSNSRGNILDKIRLLINM